MKSPFSHGFPMVLTTDWILQTTRRPRLFTLLTHRSHGYLRIWIWTFRKLFIAQSKASNKTGKACLDTLTIFRCNTYLLDLVGGIPCKTFEPSVVRWDCCWPSAWAGRLSADPGNEDSWEIYRNRNIPIAGVGKCSNSYWLVVWAPLKNMKVNWDDYSQYMGQ